jgi:hypothetical protein
VRSDTPGASLKLRLREYCKDTGALVGSASATTVLTTSWQQVQVAYTPVAVGASTLDYTASVGDVAAGSVCFDADDATIGFDPVPAAALSVTPASGTVPVSVHADASASTANAGTSYSFDFGDGSAVVGPQYTATADHSYYAAGTYTVTVELVYQEAKRRWRPSRSASARASSAIPPLSLVPRAGMPRGRAPA